MSPNEPSVPLSGLSCERVAQAGSEYLLRTLDATCRKAGVSYFLTAGTLLGCIRHAGWIPWDDDVDVGMMRAQYAHLQSYVDSTPGALPAGVYLSDPRRSRHHGVTDFPHLVLADSCINDPSAGRDDLTARLTLDIFLFDPAPTGRVARRVWLVLCVSLRRLSQFIRRLQQSPRFFGRPARWIDRRRISVLYNWVSALWQSRPAGRQWLSTSYAWHHIGSVLPAQDILQLSERTFEGHQYPVPGHAEGYLEQMYGRFRILPPPDQQRAPHPLEMIEISLPSGRRRADRSTGSSAAGP